MDPQILIVLVVVAATVAMIITEVVRIDVVALLAMLVLAWTGIITPTEARSGFASNAVLAIVAVMIMGRGLHKSGVTEKIASFILTVAGKGRRRIVSTVGMTVGVMSAFMQNIGAAALFLPVMTGISERERIPISSLLMPMGFAALLGGTLTMVGTSSLIVLNDLMEYAGLEPFGLFAVAPVGIVLLLAGIAYFFVLGPLVLPKGPPERSKASSGTDLLDAWGLSDRISTLQIPEDSPLIGVSVEESKMGEKYQVNLLRIYDDDESEYKIWKDHRFRAGRNIDVQGRKRHIQKLVDDYGLELKHTEKDAKSRSDASRGYLEVVIPARSNLVDKTLRELALREKHNTQVVLYFSNSEVIDEKLADRPIQAGDTMVLHGRWEQLQYFTDNENYVTVTPVRYEPKSPDKALFAVASFATAIVLVAVMGFPISVGFLTGALAMVLGKVMTIEEAYRAVEWKVIFLIAGLIPIGLAMENSGTASMLADNLVGLIGGLHPYFILLALGVLMTAFSLTMSNVAATVLMVPLVLELAGIGGLDSRVMVLQVGLCAANSFLIPTHHVNALLMTPGGYRVTDYVKAGGILSVIFVVISTTVLYFFF